MTGGRQLVIAGARLDHAVDVRARQLDELVRAALERSDQPYPPNTQRAYARAWATWAAWCERRGIVELTPVNPHELCGLLEELDRAGMSRNTVELTVSAISAIDTWCRSRAGDNPTPVRAHSRVRGWLASFREGRSEERLRKAPALLRPELVAVVDAIGREAPRRGIAPELAAWAARRDHALILVGWFGAFRCETLARLQVADIIADGNGLDIVTRKTKTRRTSDSSGWSYLYAQTAPELCPRTAWLRWLEARGPHVPTDPAFPSREGKRMRPEVVSRVVSRRCEAARVEGSGHSLRSGLATWAKLCGKPESDIQRHGDWASADTMRGYFQQANAREGNPTKGLM